MSTTTPNLGLTKPAPGDPADRNLWGGTLNGNCDIIDAALAGFVNVKHYGAKGDGVANDTAAIQNAIGAASGGLVYFPSGTYKISATINLPAGMQFLGSGWGTSFVPTSDSIGVMFNVTGKAAWMRDLQIDASSIANPTFTAIKVNSSGFVRGWNIRIYGAGIGLDFPAGNACDFAGFRIEQCPLCVRTGGVASVFPGDTTWLNMVLIPTATGTGMIIDGNTNAQTLTNVKIIGGAKALYLRGAGASTGRPDGILIQAGNFTASSGAVVQIDKGTEVQFNDTVIGGSTGGDGLLINGSSGADVDGVILIGSQVRANFQRGVNWQGGANLQVVGGQVYGNSDGGGAGVYSNIYVGAGAKGLCHISGVIAGLSAGGEVFANIQAPAKYGIELASGALTSATNFPGRLIVRGGNVLEGNTTGRISDASAAGYKYIEAGQNPSNTAAIAVGASPFVYTAGGSPEVVYIDGGTVSAVATAGATVFTSTNHSMPLEPGMSVTVTYSVVPTMKRQVL